MDNFANDSPIGTSGLLFASSGGQGMGHHTSPLLVAPVPWYSRHTMGHPTSPLLVALVLVSVPSIGPMVQ